MTSKPHGLVKRLRSLDRASVILTGKKLSENLTAVAGFVKGHVGEGLPSGRPAQDPQEMADCELLGVSPNCSQRVARLAFRAFAEAHHPDRPGGNQETFKLGGAAFERLCLRHGWSPR